MIGEIALAIKALDSAYTICRDVVGKTKDINDWAGAVNNFLFAKSKVDEHIAQAEKEGREELFEGSALQEAMSIRQHKDQHAAMMARIGKAYSDAGKAHVWGQIKIDAIRIQRKRDAKAKKDAQMKKESKNQDEILIEQLAKTFLSVIVAIVIIAGIAFMVFGSGAE